MVYNNIPTFSALTLWITSRHTATSFNTSDRGFPLHFPALILFCLLHWATLSLLSTTCWVSSSATKKMHIYILHHSSTKILTLQSHTRAQWTNREDPFSRTLHVQHPECARQPRKMGAAELKNSRVLQIWLWRRPKYRQCSFVMVNMPRQGNKSLLRCEGLRYRSRAAQQGCGDCQRGISSGQTNVVFWVFYFSSGEKDRLLSPNINNYIFKSHTVGIMYSNNWAFRVFLPKRNKEKTKKHFVPVYWTNRFSNRKNFLTAIKDGL